MTRTRRLGRKPKKKEDKRRRIHQVHEVPSTSGQQSASRTPPQARVVVPPEAISPCSSPAPRSRSSSIDSLASSGPSIPDLPVEDPFILQLDDIEVDEAPPHNDHEVDHEDQVDHEDGDVEDREIYNAQDFTEEYMSMFICSGSMTKNCARRVWNMVRKLIAPIEKHLPPYLTGAEVEAFVNGTPRVYTDYLLEDLSDNSMVTLTRKEKFELKKYPPHQFKLHHEVSYSTITDVIEFLNQFHDDKRIRGREIILGWDDVQENKSQSYKLSVFAMALSNCKRKPVALKTSKAYVKGDYSRFDSLFESIKDEIVEGNHTLKALVCDKVVRINTGYFFGTN